MVLEQCAKPLGLKETELFVILIVEERWMWLNVTLHELINMCGMEKTSESAKVM
jgi:hypothetical protein